MSSEPALSVVVAGSRAAGLPAGFEGVLARDLRSGRVELLISTARSGGSAPTGACVLDHPSSTTLPQLRLSGVRAARAPLVALTEDFCLPAAGWANVLIEEHGQRQPAALGGAVSRHAGSAVDWARTLVEYGRFFRDTPSGWVADLSSINVAYDAEWLRASLPDREDGLFEVELHQRLRERGARFWRASGATIFDESHHGLAQTFRAQFHHGRLFGGRRVQGRGVAARMGRLALTPFVPAALLSRIVPEVLAVGHGLPLVRSGPALGLLLSAWTLGEAIGSISGEGSSESHWT